MAVAARPDVKPLCMGFVYCITFGCFETIESTRTTKASRSNAGRADTSGTTA